MSTPFLINAVTDAGELCLKVQCPNCGYAALLRKPDIEKSNSLIAPDMNASERENEQSKADAQDTPASSPHPFQGLTDAPCEQCNVSFSVHP